MRTRIVTSILLIALLLGGCTTSREASTVEVSQSGSEVLPGVFLSNDPADFSFPTSGYTVYIVGETHGNPQTKQVFQAYLQSLYREAGVRDIILEEDQAYETDAHAYVRGSIDELVPELCLRADVLKIIREFNASLAADEKVTVHLVDVDSPLPAIHRHLAELHAKLGPAAETIEFPTEEEFTTWYTTAMYELIDELRKAADGQADVLNGLDTASLSLDWYILGNRLDSGQPRGAPQTFAPIREEVITKNIQHVLSQSNGDPILAFFGANHGMKTQAVLQLPKPDFQSWAQRLMEADISVYSLPINGLSGNGYWHGESFPYKVQGKQYEGTAGYKFEDGTSLVSLFKTYPNTGILYADLRTAENANIQLPPEYLDVPAGAVYDGLIIFKEFTPMEDACPP